MASEDAVESVPVLRGGSGRRFFQAACAERMDGFVGVRLMAMESGSGNPAKAWPQPKGQPVEMAARAAAIVAEKKERDRVARESGVGRPGQLRGRS
jgi:hypothetical protein